MTEPNSDPGNTDVLTGRRPYVAPVWEKEDTFEVRAIECAKADDSTCVPDVDSPPHLVDRSVHRGSDRLRQRLGPFDGVIPGTDEGAGGDHVAGGEGRLRQRARPGLGGAGVRRPAATRQLRGPGLWCRFAT